MGQSTIPSTHFSTDNFEIWREAVSVAYDVQRQHDKADVSFTAVFDAFQLGDMVVTDARLGEQRYVRSSRQARRDGVDHFVVNLYRSGGWRAQTADGEFEGTAGQVSIIDLSSDLVSDEPECNLVALFVPRSLLEDRLPGISALHGRAPGGPHAGLLADYINLLARRLPTLPSGDEQALSRATCEMLVACLQPTLSSIEAARPGLELVLQHRAKRFIDAHLQSPELNAETICNAVGVSRRTLYRLFDHEGGVHRCIQSRRLERIRAALVDPIETRRISEIAAEFGFIRSDHFATAFKHQFGCSASETRQAALQQIYHSSVSAVSASSSEHSLASWIRDLPTSSG